MITAMLVGLLQLAAPSAPAPVDEVGGGDVVFTRVEPHLAAGARALAANDPELALERYRRAEATTDEQRAVVEYNAGQALLMQAMKTAAAQQPQGAPPAAGGEPAAPPPPPDVGDALSSFERAAALGKAPTFVSEARLAAGNAALVGNKLDDAIAQLRKALVADPRNERARHNLQRALELKQQQPPQQNDGEGDKNDDQQQDKKEESDEQKNEGEQKNDEQKNDKGDQKSDEQKNDKGDKDEQKGDEQKGDEQKSDKGEQKSDARNNDGEQQDKNDKGEEKPDGAAGEAKPAPKKPTSREEARRLLEGVRSREKPLSPIEMRGAERRPADNGKDW